MEEDAGKPTGRIVADTADGRLLKSLVTSEQQRLRHRMNMSPVDAYWTACTTVGDMCVPKLTAEEVNKRATHYVVEAGRETKRRLSAMRAGLVVSNDGSLGDNWYEVPDPGLTRTQELSRYLRDAKVGIGRMKRGLTKKDAKNWQTAMSAWARRSDNKSQWYDREGPKFSTTVVEVAEKEWGVIITKHR